MIVLVVELNTLNDSYLSNDDDSDDTDADDSDDDADDNDDDADDSDDDAADTDADDDDDDVNNLDLLTPSPPPLLHIECTLTQHASEILSNVFALKIRFSKKFSKKSNLAESQPRCRRPVYGVYLCDIL